MSLETIEARTYKRLFTHVRVINRIPSKEIGCSKEWWIKLIIQKDLTT